MYLREFEKALTIGHSAKPRAFRNISTNSLSIDWTYNKKAWMTTDIFAKWIKEFDSRMRRQNRKVLLFVDNAPSHPKDIVLTNTKMVFFPANTTAVLQPLDQGIIAVIKRNYRRRLLKAVLTRMYAREDITQVKKCVSLLDACHWIKDAVNEMKTTTV